MIQVQNRIFTKDLSPSLPFLCACANAICHTALFSMFEALIVADIYVQGTNLLKCTSVIAIRLVKSQGLSI